MLTNLKTGKTNLLIINAILLIEHKTLVQKFCFGLDFHTTRPFSRSITIIVSLFPVFFTVTAHQSWLVWKHVLVPIKKIWLKTMFSHAEISSLQIIMQKVTPSRTLKNICTKWNYYKSTVLISFAFKNSKFLQHLEILI